MNKEILNKYRVVLICIGLAVLTFAAFEAGRYFKAYLADRLDGEWKELAATREKSFASKKNVKQTAGHWRNSISHGELLRSGYDKKLEVDPTNPRFLFQGVTKKEKDRKNYGEIPWRVFVTILKFMCLSITYRIWPAIIWCWTHVLKPNLFASLRAVDVLYSQNVCTEGRLLQRKLLTTPWVPKCSRKT